MYVYYEKIVIVTIANVIVAGCVITVILSLSQFILLLVYSIVSIIAITIICCNIIIVTIVVY